MTNKIEWKSLYMHDKCQDCKEESGLHDKTRLDGRVDAFMTSQKSGLGDRYTEV